MFTDSTATMADGQAVTSTPAKAKCHASRDGEEDGSSFFDSLSRRWVKLDNFAFADGDNHFNATNAGSAQGLNVSKSSAEDAGSILDSTKLGEEEFSVAVGDGEDFEELFRANTLVDGERSQPKIVSSPRHQQPGSPKSVKPGRKLSGAGLDIVLVPKVVDAMPVTSGDACGNGSVRRFVKRGSHHRPSPVEKKLDLASKRGRSETRNSDCGHKNYSHKRSRSLHSMASDIGDGQTLSRSETNLITMDRRPDYRNVTSKVKAYIDEVKRLPSKSPTAVATAMAVPPEDRKSKSLSNLAANHHYADDKSLARMKAFISSTYLDETTVTLEKDGDGGLRLAGGGDLLAERFDRSRISRLLEHLSDEDAASLSPRGGEADQQLTVDAGHLLALAMEERRSKREAERVLGQLQQNYDRLQRKYAEAENRIDRLRFGQPASGATGAATEAARSNVSPVNPSFADSAFAEADSGFLQPMTAREARECPAVVYSAPRSDRGHGATSAAFSGRRRSMMLAHLRALEDQVMMRLRKPRTSVNHEL